MMELVVTGQTSVDMTIENDSPVTSGHIGHKDQNFVLTNVIKTLETGQTSEDMTIENDASRTSSNLEFIDLKLEPTSEFLVFETLTQNSEDIANESDKTSNSNNLKLDEHEIASTSGSITTDDVLLPIVVSVKSEREITPTSNNKLEVAELVASNIQLELNETNK
jgi:hypothetical protein